jgi:hypothetical protein
VSAQNTPAEPGKDAAAATAEIMEQAQVFASSWALVGSRFDNGTALDDAKEALEELRVMVSSLTALAARAALAASPQPAAQQPKPLDDPRLQELFMSAITGAMAFGYQGTDRPPVGHWLNQAWQIGRAEAEKVAAQQPVAVPHPGSLAASNMIDTLLAEYNYPANTKNAARAGYVAAMRLLAAPPQAPSREPQEFVCSTGLCHYRAHGITKEGGK